MDLERQAQGKDKNRKGLAVESMVVKFEAKEIVVRLLTPMLQHHACHNGRVEDMTHHRSSVHVYAVVRILNAAPFCVCREGSPVIEDGNRKIKMSGRRK
jgi:hypothetical protein